MKGKGGGKPATPLGQDRCRKELEIDSCQLPAAPFPGKMSAWHRRKTEVGVGWVLSGAPNPGECSALGQGSGRAEDLEGNRAHAGPLPEPGNKTKDTTGKGKAMLGQRASPPSAAEPAPPRPQHLSQPGFSHAEKLNYQSFRLTLSPSDSPG